MGRQTADDDSDVCVRNVYLREAPLLRRVAAGMGFAASDVDDVLQDVFVQALKDPPPVRSSPDARRWLVRVTINRCLLEFRRRQRFQRAASEVLRRVDKNAADPSDDANRSAARAEELDAVREALRDMDARLLAPLVLRYFCEMDSGAIGELLNQPAATVRSRLREGRLLLARRLLERGIES